MRAASLLVVPLLAIAAASAGCDRPEPAAKVEPPRPVRTVVVSARSGSVALQLPGEVRPRIESRLGFRVGGKLAQRTVSVGDAVSPGQVLARLDPTDLAPAVQAQQAQLVAARTDRDLAAVELDRLRNLRGQNYISQASLDRQQAAHDAAVARTQAAEAQLLQARNALDFQVLRADAAGVVTAIEAEPGQVVTAGQPVVRVARTGEREIAVNVPEGALALARSNREWAVVVPALGGRTLAGRLRELSPISDPASRTYPARLSVSGDLDGLALGMTAVVQALRTTEAEFVLPLSALHSRDGQPRVWRVDPATGTVEPVEVRTAGLLDDAVRVTGGLSAGDRIVTAGANLLVAGQPVRLLDAPMPSAAAAPAPVARGGAAAGAAR
ncbi:MAG TPA: efflux RND transporter periplasmic adaptor subunit [Burkholderiaceae bacterium]|nr:efflux RND transporter periplasmic adaptor subunit [Burkholderiaceae bacterium]